jgi:hypothetical protein
VALCVCMFALRNAAPGNSKKVLSAEHGASAAFRGNEIDEAPHARAVGFFGLCRGFGFCVLADGRRSSRKRYDHKRSRPCHFDSAGNRIYLPPHQARLPAVLPSQSLWNSKLAEFIFLDTRLLTCRGSVLTHRTRKSEGIAGGYCARSKGQRLKNTSSSGVSSQVARRNSRGFLCPMVQFDDLRCFDRCWV